MFRAILVGESSESITQADPLKRNARNPLLWDKAEWNRQSEWQLVFKKTGNKPLTSEDQPCPAKDYMAQICKWTRGDRRFKKPPQTFWMVTQSEPNDPEYSYASVWSYYCDQVHLTAHGEQIGRTEIFAIGDELFSRSMKEGGFGGCPDLVFLGTCTATEEDIWCTEATPRWSLAMMSSMSTQTRTMFLTLIHGPEAIIELWEDIKRAKAALPTALVDTTRDGFSLPKRSSNDTSAE